MKISDAFGQLFGKIDYERAILKFVRDFCPIFAANAALVQGGVDASTFWQSMGLAAGLAAYRVGRDLLGFPADGPRVTPSGQ